MVVQADSACPLGAHTCRLLPGHLVQEVTVLRPGCSSGPRAGSGVRTPTCDWAKRGQTAGPRQTHLGTVLIHIFIRNKTSQARIL